MAMSTADISEMFLSVFKIALSCLSIFLKSVFKIVQYRLSIFKKLPYHPVDFQGREPNVEG